MTLATTTESLVTKYGHLLTQAQLAEVLQRKVTGLRWSLCRTQNDPAIAFIRKIERAIGRRKYYPAADVARLIDGTATS